MLTDDAVRVFRNRFGGSGTVQTTLAPGRVNLIGEHTDYNDGFVLPMAIERHVAVAFSASEDSGFRIWSDHFQDEATFQAKDLRPGSLHGWSTYPAGMCWAAQRSGHALKGMRAAIVADIPIGAGVSSSAALEVSFGLALSVVSGLQLAPAQIAELSHVADNEFVGIPSGIMDQYASALCRKGHALLIDCRTAGAEPVHIPEDVVFVVMDTGKRRGLVDSEYADRVAACRRVAEAARRLRPGISALRDVTEADLDVLRPSIDEKDYQRALHVVNENRRTLEAVERLRAGEAETFGDLMVASHESLRDLYEVSCEELDIAVSIALEHPECLGARMTGGGFGGCALALVRSAAAADFVDRTAASYSRRSGLSGAFFPVSPAAGVRLA